MTFRIIFAEGEMEPADAGVVIRAIRGEAIKGAQAVLPVAQLAAAAPEAKAKRETAKVGEGARRARRGREAGVPALVRQALKEGPKTAGQVRDWLRNHGHGPLHKSVAQVIWSLIKQREIERGSDGVCRWL